MRIAVTGYDGYVGSHVVSALREAGVEIAVLVREGAAQAAAAAGYEPLVGSLEQPEAFIRALTNTDAVGHFAASERPGFLEVNSRFIRAVIGELRTGRAFVMQGGSMVFGAQGRTSPAREPKFAPPPPLAERTALEAEVLAAASAGTRSSIVYGSFVFGARGAMIPNALAAAARQAGYAAYPEDGSAVWSGVHVADWADLIARVLLSDAPGGEPVFAAGQDVRIRSAAEVLAGVMEPPVEARSVSIEKARELWPFFADGLLIDQRFDGDAARNRFGWAPPHRSLEDAFDEALAATGEVPMLANPG